VFFIPQPPPSSSCSRKNFLSLQQKLCVSCLGSSCNCLAFGSWGSETTVWREVGREDLWRLCECVRRGGRIPLTNVVQLRVWEETENGAWMMQS
jgi:hypothetical protein